MRQPDHRVLESLRDFIGDALSEPDINPTDIVHAIRDELSSLLDYHRVSADKAEKTLSLFSEAESDPSLDSLIDDWTKFAVDHETESAQDRLTFGDYDYCDDSSFKLDSSYLKPYVSGDDILRWKGNDDDVIDFDVFKKNRDK